MRLSPEFFAVFNSNGSTAYLLINIKSIRKRRNKKAAIRQLFQ